MKINTKIFISTALLLSMIFLFSARIVYPQNSSIQNQKNQSNATAGKSSSIIIKDGKQIIILTQKEQQNSGIKTTRLLKRTNKDQLTTYGYVVSIQDLSDDAQNFEAAKAQLLKSKENLLISQKNYERIKSLYQKKLESEQDYQTAQAAYLSDEADVASNRLNLASIKSKITEQWGNGISKSIFEDSPTLQNLLSLNETLIQISLPPGKMNIKIPDKIFIIYPQSNSKKIICRFISESYLANSQFQTKTLFYISSVNSLSSGMNVEAFLPVGKALTGVIIPQSSIVWYNGKAWVYAETGEGKFIRIAVNTNNQTANGFFIHENKGELKPGAKIVTWGAELLLSKELLPVQKTSAGGEDHD